MRSSVSLGTPVCLGCSFGQAASKSVCVTSNAFFVQCYADRCACVHFCRAYVSCACDMCVHARVSVHSGRCVLWLALSRLAHLSLLCRHLSFVVVVVWLWVYVCVHACLCVTPYPE
jgi:hypothetical protein